MRTLTTAERNIISASAGAWCFAYMELQRFDGTWLNIGALAAGSSTIDLFTSCTITDTIDDNSLSMTAVFQRESGIFSLAPFRTDSPLNDAGDGTYSPLVDLHRAWRIKVAVVARGTTPTMGTTAFREMATGIVDRIDVAGDPATVTIQGRGMEADLIDAWIPVSTRTYGADDLSINLGDTLQAMLNDQGFSDTILSYDPSDPSFAPALWAQREGHLFPAMTDVAALPGANIRYRHDASDVNRLTLFTPSRDAVTPDWTIADTEYQKVDVALDLSGVRNYIPVTYVDATLGEQTVVSPGAESGTVTAVAGAATFSVTQADVLVSGAIIVVAGVAYVVSAFNGTTGCTLSGAPTFTGATWYTSASITRYGLRTMPIDLAATSQVVTSGSAGNLADAIRSDLESPALDQQLVGTGLWFVQLHDYVQVVANGVQSNEDQFGGVTSYTQSFQNGLLTTTIGLRGTPAGRYRTWLSVGSNNAATSTATPVAITSSSATFVEWADPLTPDTFGIKAVCTISDTTQSLKYELSLTSGFGVILETQNTNAALGLTNGTTFVIDTADREPTYYVRITPYSGPAETDFSDTTGYAGASAVAATFSLLAPTDSATATFNLSVPGQFSVDVIGATPSATSFVALTDAATITWATGGASVNNATVTLGGNRTLSITGQVSGAEGYLEVLQDSTGGRTLTLPSGTVVGSTTSIGTTANKRTALAWSYNGSTMTFVLAREA